MRPGGFLLPVFLFAFSILSQTGCGNSDSTDRQANESFPAEPTPSIEYQSAMPKVFATLPESFKGAIKVEIKEAIPLEPDEKPGGEGPRHVYLAIEGDYAERVSSSAFTPGISVYDVEMFREVLASRPEQLARFNESLDELKSLLNEKGDLRSQGEIQTVCYIEETQVLRAHPKYISFKNGYALAYLTQFQPDPGYIVNRGLTYLVQGLTFDGKHFLFGTFPVGAGFLPADSDISDFEGYKIPMLTPTDAEAQEHSRYLKKIERRLADTPPGMFQPDLREIDKLIASIEIGSE